MSTVDCPLCDDALPEGDELFDHISDHDRLEVVAWVYDQVT